MEQFADKLKILRKKNSLTQQNMADALKISQPSYANYERGISEPSIDALRIIADIFKVSLDELIGREDLQK